ncbi:DUF402 domain-containing protein [Saccharothrix sp. ST-888]|uniref:DUF402 domain-containing protein n=1 Tax=Saccharothrix sp. ST-888 TaxID=1427391 RepID=UPI0009E604CE|nr:DUF402 domain-containing protein [Saccharothrix sp. ST-888]
MYFDAGRIVRWNFSFGGQLLAVVPVRVVAHGADGLWLWMAGGSPVWEAQLPEGRHIRDIDPAEWPAGGYRLVPGRWYEGGSLIFEPSGAGYAVWWHFAPEPGSAFKGWYVNLERRTRRGDDIDVADLELDLTVAADGSWQWKDEESFAAKTGHPAYWTVEQAAEVRAEGERVARLAEVRRFPFDGSRCGYRPPAEWGRPPLPPAPSVLARPAVRPAARSGEVPAQSGGPEPATGGEGRGGSYGGEGPAGEKELSASGE